MDAGRSSPSLGLAFFNNFYKLCKLFYPSWEYAVLLTAILFIISGSYEVIAYHSGTVVGEFYQTLLNRDEKAFWNVFYKASLIYVGQTLVKAVASLCSWLLAVALRRNLVTGLHRLYFRRHVYYNINTTHKENIDNPDQRITQDAEKLTTLLAVNVIPYFIISGGVIGYYTFKTWEQAGPIGVGCIYGYFLIGSVANRIIVSPITKWTARLERAEGDFRYKHVSIRNNAEESAFYEAHNFEHVECTRFMRALLFVQAKLAVWKFPAQYLQNFFDYYGGILTYAIQVIPVFFLHSYKDYTPADLAKQISNNAFFFMYLINSFTRLTDLAMNIGEMAGYTHRIATLIDLTRLEKPPKWDAEQSPDMLSVFKIEDITFTSSVNDKRDFSDQKRPLLSHLSLDISTLQTLLVTGDSGTGKTSLFRILNQLWSSTSGKIHRYIDLDKIMFLPQRPYLPVGNLSLRQQVLFPTEDDASIDDQEIISVLGSLSLAKLCGLCGSIDDLTDFEWQDVLSPGEQQRLSIARVLIRKPKVVILDEATSCIGEDMEKHIYDLFKKSKIHFISIGHRTSLYYLHEEELHLEPLNSYTIRNIPQQDVYEKSVHF